MAAAVRCAAPSLPASSTALVISSTNRGMPSVRSMMSCRTLAGRSLLPTTRSIMALISRSASRLRVRTVTCGRPIHGGANSGRNMTIGSSPRLAPINRPDQIVLGWSDESDARPRRSSQLPDLACRAPRFVQ